MKLQISFTYDGVKYRQTIDENDIDIEHYDYMWGWWFGENSNELANLHYIEKDNENELIFEVTADKKWVEEKNDYIICGEGIYINVYQNTYEDNYCAKIDTNEIEVLYA